MSQRGGRVKLGLLIFIFLVGCVVVAVVTWHFTKRSNENNTSSHTSPQKSVTEMNLGETTIQNNLKIDIKRKTQTVLSGQLWDDKLRVNFKEWSNTNDWKRTATWSRDRKLDVSYKEEGGVPCYQFHWKVTVGLESVLSDCWDIGDAHWYGGFEDYYQPWPLEKMSRNMSAYIVDDSYQKKLGGVQERYFITSKGVGIYIEEDVPLYISINASNDRKVCLQAKYEKYPYQNYKKLLPSLNYHICVSTDVKLIHDFMSRTFIKLRPTDIPDSSMFRKPIWSTWAQYHKDINQSLILDFANNIIRNNFTHSQLEIDDDWTPKYGDIDFNVAKFPNARAMIKQLNDMGFRVTVWLHPFFNLDSNAFTEAASRFFLIRQFDSPLPGLVSWWDGKLAGIIDATNPEAVEWYLNQTKFLQNTYNISSFKFDAGEVNWLPKVYSANFDIPNEYSKHWANLAYKADETVRHQEVRVGYKTQDLPIFVRMLDKDSNWDYTNGLKTLIPTALTFGILGYPFILPDMIGGNAYYTHPERELYIRWMQANVFLPSLQFSIVPWQYDEEVINLTRRFIQLHEDYTETILKLAREATATGAPIVRPLWWIAPKDEVALTIDSEFLLGNDILVAPVLDKGASSRDVYLPGGQWNDVLRGGVKQGGWYRNYKADLHELPYFIRNN
ncbi:myogenesis-regulating glycosidase-like [Saccostrea cucullata]|uniref:myogenesis-regulating glycosidase-like n=1 Tax=Saccostrea cuccullata TaxID=36930 RepID=UPI002ED64E9E